MKTNAISDLVALPTYVVAGAGAGLLFALAIFGYGFALEPDFNLGLAFLSLVFIVLTGGAVGGFAWVAVQVRLMVARRAEARRATISGVRITSSISAAAGAVLSHWLIGVLVFRVDNAPTWWVMLTGTALVAFVSSYYLDPRWNRR